MLLTTAACYHPEPQARESGPGGDDSTGESEGGSACVVGALGCPCDGADACEAPLACVDAVCVDVTEASSSDDGGTSSDGSDSSSTGVDVDPSGGEGPWSAWSHHRALTISSDVDLDDHQVRVDLPLTADMAPDGADVRVVDADGNEVPSWVDGPDATHLRLWIRVTQAFGSGDYTIYYGNPAATSVSDPHAVFELFDDFDDLDATQWNYYDPTSWSLGADGAITTSSAAGSVWTTDAPVVVEAVVRWGPDGGVEASTGVMFLGSFGGVGVAGMPLSFVVASDHEPLGPGRPDAPVHMTLTRRPDAYEVAIDDETVGVQLADPIDGPYYVGIGRLTGANEAPDTMEIDRLFVRRYAPSPTVALGPEQ